MALLSVLETNRGRLCAHVNSSRSREDPWRMFKMLLCDTKYRIHAWVVTSLCLKLHCITAQTWGALSPLSQDFLAFMKRA